ncbi:MAG TPA: glycoside hydrolase family 3 N-terminal domain-containing protein [Marmoricola sp.]
MRSATTLASVALVSALTGTLLLAGSPGAPGAGAQSLSAHDRALAAYNRMSVRERVGQLFMSGVTTTGATSSERHDLDRVAAGNVYLREGSSASVATIAKRVHTMRSDRTYARVRPFVATDQEGGLVQRLKGSGFDTIPSALAQGRWGPKTLRARAQRWGGQLRSAGLTMDLAPVGDVVPAKNAHRNQPIGRYDREYGHTPLRAGRHVASFTRGMSAAGIATTVKHFPGLGRATGNTDTERRVTDPTTAHDPYLASFEHGIKAGVSFVMVSSAIYPHIDAGHRACFSATVLRLLRSQLGFKGVIVSDSFGAASLQGTPVAKRAVKFFRAGGTMVLDSSAAQVAAMVDGVRARMRSHPGFRTTIRAAVLKVLETKAARGLIS